MRVLKFILAKKNCICAGGHTADILFIIKCLLTSSFLLLALFWSLEPAEDLYLSLHVWKISHVILWKS